MREQVKERTEPFTGEVRVRRDSESGQMNNHLETRPWHSTWKLGKGHHPISEKVYAVQMALLVGAYCICNRQNCAFNEFLTISAKFLTPAADML
jgi:hypothetical protein